MGCLASRPGDGSSGGKYAASSASGPRAGPASDGPTTPSGDDAEGPGGSLGGLRQKGMTERLIAAGAGPSGSLGQYAGGREATEEELVFIKDALQHTVLFHQLDPAVRDGVARAMTRAEVALDQRLIVENDLGSELFLVQEGTFDVKCERNGVEVKVNAKTRGDIFGEIALMFESPRTASVVAASEGCVVWVLERQTFREMTRKVAIQQGLERELFLNSVPSLARLTAEERTRVASALAERRFEPGEVVVRQGDEDADTFYLVAEGEAVVSVEAGGEKEGDEGERGGRKEGAESSEAAPATPGETAESSVSPAVSAVSPASAATTRVVNRLFRADFFGETALLKNEARNATVTAAGSAPLVCLCLNREDFVSSLGSLQDIMTREKSPEVVAQRMIELSGQIPWRPATVTIVSVDAKTGETREARAVGACSGATFDDARGDGDANANAAGGSDRDRDHPTKTRPPIELVLTEGKLLGGGASGSVRRVDCAVGAGSVRPFALKRMRKLAVMSTPEHILCEQSITREVRHFACMRQHASFQDAHYLYFLFDYVEGCDLMDALAAVATVRSIRQPSKGVFGPKIKMLRGMRESQARYYVAAVTLALEYLHSCHIVYRDLKPENVLLSLDGAAKLGDFGFSKKLEKGSHTYTFCGTPGYVAPEVVLARGYGTSVDWWGLGVLTYVLLTGQQPFSQTVNGQPEDPLTVMKRIVDRSWAVSFPVYVSDAAVDMMSWFLERRSVKRLGNLRRKANDVKEHAWFRDAGFDWEKMQRGELAPSPLDLSESFAKKHEDRMKQLEREIARNAPRSDERENAEASEIFKNF